MSVGTARAGWRRLQTRVSLPEVHGTISVPDGAGAVRRFLAFVGPGYLVAVGYMDPGNWATDIAGGARYAYSLLSVIFLANLAAVLLQSIAARLGIATGRDLAQACRDTYGRRVSLGLWLICEVAIAACDLAEVLGAAVALQLLFGLPLAWGVCLTALDVLVVLGLQHRGFRYVEGVVAGLIVLIGVSFAIELYLSQPDIAAVGRGFLPSVDILRNAGKLYVAVGIVGATVMPHNLYLHSSIVQTRRYPQSVRSKREAIRFAFLDTVGALTAALFVNAAILVMSAAVFHLRHENVADITDAYRLLAPLLGTQIAATVFGVALLLSGLNATLTGTLAGQIVMEGFLNLHVQPWMRRLMTRVAAILPALVVTSLYGDQGIGPLLILSQVVLSLQLPFAVIPLVMFAGDRSKMGPHVAPRWLVMCAWLVAGAIVALNGWLLYQIVTAS